MKFKDKNGYEFLGLLIASILKHEHISLRYYIFVSVFINTCVMTTLAVIFQLIILVACLRSSKSKKNDTEERSRQLAFTISNYPEWDDFWVKFKLAVSQKNNFRILGLVNFPLLQNGGNIGDIEFMDKWLSRLNGIEKATEPVEVERSHSRGANIPQMDSVRHTNFGQMDIYFARVNGHYKLVRIITLR